jgi:hypothetical protein
MEHYNQINNTQLQEEQRCKAKEEKHRKEEERLRKQLFDYFKQWVHPYYEYKINSMTMEELFAFIKPEHSKYADCYQLQQVTSTSNTDNSVDMKIFKTKKAFNKRLRLARATQR